MTPRRPRQAETRRGNDYLAPRQPPRMKLMSFRPLVKNSLRGFVSLELPNGLRLLECPVLVSHGKAWVSLPGRPILDENGRHKRDLNDKLQYAPVIQWRDRDLSDRFSDAVIALIREAHPGALDGATP
jgi:hypothetical protein